jgi:nitrogen fixation NifU-like protein
MALSAESTPPVPLVASLPPDAGAASLYQDIILSHYRAPRHKGVIAGATAAVEHRNPLCGDVMSVQFVIDGDTITDAAFSARACSITQATASMLLSRIIGTHLTDARNVVAEVERLIDAPMVPGEMATQEMGDLRALASVARFPARKACVRLVTGAVTEAIGTV